MEANRSPKKTVTRRSGAAFKKVSLSAVQSGMTAGRSRRAPVKKVKPSRMVKEVQYVLPLGNGWVVKGSKTNRFTTITDSKAEAIAIARLMAQNKHVELVVHGKDGAIELRENYVP